MKQSQRLVRTKQKRHDLDEQTDWKVGSRDVEQKRRKKKDINRLTKETGRRRTRNKTSDVAEGHNIVAEGVSRGIQPPFSSNSLLHTPHTPPHTQGISHSRVYTFQLERDQRTNCTIFIYRSNLSFYTKSFWFAACGIFINWALDFSLPFFAIYWAVMSSR